MPRRCHSSNLSTDGCQIDTDWQQLAIDNKRLRRAKPSVRPTTRRRAATKRPRVEDVAPPNSGSPSRAAWKQKLRTRTGSFPVRRKLQVEESDATSLLPLQEDCEILATGPGKSGADEVWIEEDREPQADDDQMN